MRCRADGDKNMLQLLNLNALQIESALQKWFGGIS